MPPVANEPCRRCGQPVTAAHRRCPECGRRWPIQGSGPDWGVVVVILIVLAIPVVGWQLISHLTGSGAEPSPSSPSTPSGDHRARLAAARATLDQLRMEASLSGMPEMWQAKILAQQSEVARLRRLTEEQEKR